MDRELECSILEGIDKIVIERELQYPILLKTVITHENRPDSASTFPLGIVSSDFGQFRTSTFPF